MRLWTLSPRYLDNIGLVAAWREALLAKKCIYSGYTCGYSNHSQLDRFKAQKSFGKHYINEFLLDVYHESIERNMNFNENLIDWSILTIKMMAFVPEIEINLGQILYEKDLLRSKLKYRSDQARYDMLVSDAYNNSLKINRIFKSNDVLQIHSWEKVKDLVKV